MAEPDPRTRRSLRHSHGSAGPNGTRANQELLRARARHRLGGEIAVLGFWAALLVAIAEAAGTATRQLARVNLADAAIQLLVAGLWGMNWLRAPLDFRPHARIHPLERQARRWR